MKVNLKDNIWIEGFDTEGCFRKRLYGAKGINHSIELIFQGKTCDITEGLATECIDSLSWQGEGNCWVEVWYEDFSGNNKEFETAKESILSACSQEYCIIYKKKALTSLQSTYSQS